MKTRSINADKVQDSEQHRQLAQNNVCGDTHAPTSPALQNGANPDKLAQLAQDFQKAHQELDQRKLGLQAAYARSIAEVANLGRILIEAKTLSKRKWLEWLKQNTSVSAKTAQRWMAVARNASAMSNLTPTAKRLTEHYQDIGILKEKPKKPKSKGASIDDGEDSEDETDPKQKFFTKAKKLSDDLAQLAIQTDDQDRMAEAVKSFLAWYEGYLAIKKKAKEKAEQEAAFNKAISTTA